MVRFVLAGRRARYRPATGRGSPGTRRTDLASCPSSRRAHPRSRGARSRGPLSASSSRRASSRTRPSRPGAAAEARRAAARRSTCRRVFGQSELCDNAAPRASANARLTVLRVGQRSGGWLARGRRGVGGRSMRWARFRCRWTRAGGCRAPDKGTGGGHGATCRALGGGEVRLRRVGRASDGAQRAGGRWTRGPSRPRAPSCALRTRYIA